MELSKVEKTKKKRSKVVESGRAPGRNLISLARNSVHLVYGFHCVGATIFGMQDFGVSCLYRYIAFYVEFDSALISCSVTM